jgi:hypothetical protein
MKYACLIYEEGNLVDRLPERELRELTTGALAYHDELRRRGQLAAAEALEPAYTATTIRIRSDKLSLTDGPFAETKEQLGGFLLIEAADLNEAIRIASKHPAARYDTIEVRPVKFDIGLVESDPPQPITA